MPQQSAPAGLAARVRALPLWQRAIVWVVSALVIVAVVVLVAKGLRALPGVASFVATYPGGTHPPSGTPQGFPAWLRWQHYLNLFFILLILRTGLRVRTVRRPAGYVSPRRRRPGKAPRKISLDLWLHQCIDVLWLLNGLVFVVLLFSTGYWARIVPTSWDVVPNALSAALQYASLDWPMENGWVSYNALQQLTYFATVFLAAPLAALSGWRMSTFYPSSPRAAKVYPLAVARAVHFPVMLYFVLFVIVHVVLVLATGALRNLNHMFHGVDVAGWTGFWIFVVGLAVAIAAMEAARPLVIRPIAALTGKVTRN